MRCQLIAVVLVAAALAVGLVVGRPTAQEGALEEWHRLEGGHPCTSAMCMN